MRWSSHPYSEKKNYIMLSELALNTDDTEATLVKVSIPSKQFLVGSIYIPHNECFNHFSSDFEKNFHT